MTLFVRTVLNGHLYGSSFVRQSRQSQIYNIEAHECKNAETNPLLEPAPAIKFLPKFDCRLQKEPVVITP